MATAITSDHVFVDTHFHIWDIKRFPYAWPTAEDQAPLYRDFLPSEYAAAIKDTPVKNAIFVQVLNKKFPENEWILEIAKTSKWIVGVVGWVDMTDPHVETVLQNASQNPLFLGIRHILDFENPDWLGRDDVQNALKVLQRLNLTYDLLLRPPSLHWAADLAPKFPNLKFIINHIAKPDIKDQVMASWQDGITKAAQYPNVYCKLSGMVTEADPKNWKTADFKPYVEHCVKQFGAKRCMFGSDFPVFKMAGASYTQVYQLLTDCLMDCTTPEERDGIFGTNAVEIYRIKVPLNK